MAGASIKSEEQNAVAVASMSQIARFNNITTRFVIQAILSTYNPPTRSMGSTSDLPGPPCSASPNLTAQDTNKR